MRKLGFTLVELAVVLVVIGILIGGVMAGRTMIDSARRTSLISDWQKYSSAANSYFTKFNYWPGDDAEATTRWSAASHNGDGNGSLGTQTSGEYMFFWEHLAVSGFINGSYSGSYSTATSVPKTQIPNAYMTHYYDGTATNQALYIIGTAPISLGNVGYSGGVGLTTLSYRAAYAIDSKIDDGVYNSGNVQAAGCSSYSNSPTIACNLYYYYKK